MKRKHKAIILYGDEAYEAIERHKDERHTAEEWLEIYSRELGYGRYNPIEVIERASAKDLEEATSDPGTALLPRYYQTERITD